jgi:hypothetical protein
MGDSLMTVQEQMTDGDGNKFNMSFEDWDVIGQGTASLSTIAAVVKQEEGDKYVTSSLVLPFINTCWKALQEMVVLSSRGWQRKREERVPCVFGPWIRQISTEKRQGGPW